MLRLLFLLKGTVFHRLLVLRLQARSRTRPGPQSKKCCSQSKRRPGRRGLQDGRRHAGNLPQFPRRCVTVGRHPLSRICGSTRHPWPRGRISSQNFPLKRFWKAAMRPASIFGCSMPRTRKSKCRAQKCFRLSCVPGNRALERSVFIRTVFSTIPFNSLPMKTLMPGGLFRSDDRAELTG